MNAAQFCGDRPAVTVLGSADPTDVEVTLSHAEFLGEVTKAANLFTSLGIGEEDVVAIVSKTHGPVPALLWGAETAGIASCLNYLLAPGVLVELLRREAAKVLVCPSPQTDPEIWAPTLAVSSSTFRAYDTWFSSVKIGCGKASSSRLPMRLAKQPVRQAAHYPTIPPRKHCRAIPYRRYHRLTEARTPGAWTPNTCRLEHGPVAREHRAGYRAQRAAILSCWRCFGLGPRHGCRRRTHGCSLSHRISRSACGEGISGKSCSHFRATIFGAVPTTIGAMANVPIDNNDISTLRLVR